MVKPAQQSQLRWLPAGLIALLGALVLLAYSNSFRGGMVIDNQVILQNDPRLREVSREKLTQIFTQEYWWPTAGTGLYRPVATLSYWFNYAVLGSGDNLFSYHIVNFLIQWLNAVLALFVFTHLFSVEVAFLPRSKPDHHGRNAAPTKTYVTWPAFFAAALFALHPVATEAVTNIVGRCDQLVVTGILSALLCYIRSTEANGWRRTGWLVAMSLTGSVGMFAKENGVVVLPVILLYAVIFHPQKWRECWRPVVAFAPVYLLFWFARQLVFGHSIPSQFPFTDNPLVGADFWTARLTAIKVLGRYLGLLLWPARLSCDYSYNEIPVTLWDWQTGVALAALVGIGVVAVLTYRRNKPVCFCIAFAAGAMLPVSNLVVLIGSIMGERYLYVPLLGAAGCAVVATRKLTGRWWPVVMSAVLVVCGVRTFVRNFDWRDSLSIWSSAVRACPGSFKTQKSYAKALWDADPQRDNSAEVLAIAGRAWAIMEHPPLPLTQQSYGVYADLGYYHVELGERLMRVPLSDAERADHYRLAVGFLQHAQAIEDAVSQELATELTRQGRPLKDLDTMGDYHIYGNLGLAQLRLGDWTKSIAAYERLNRLEPGNPKGFLGLAKAYAGRGDDTEAAICMLQALLLSGGDQAMWNEVIAHYATKFPTTDAVIVTTDRRQLNLQSALVREHLCAAYRRIQQSYHAAGNEEMAQLAGATAHKEYGCP